MRFTMDRRRALVAVMVIALAGCENKPKGTGAGGGTGAEAPGQTPRQAADDFLKTLGEGKSTPEHLTAGYRDQVARPVVDVDLAEWLSGFRGTTFVVNEETRFGDAIVLRGRAESPGQKDAFTLRMVKEDNGYKADWLHRTPRTGTGIKPPADPDLAAAQDTVRNMLDLLLGGETRQIRRAQALMTVEWKKRISPLPPNAKPKDGLEYEPGFVIEALRGKILGAVTYTLSEARLNPARDEATFEAEFEADGRKSPHLVRATKDKTTGRWLVSAFDR